MLMGIGPCLFTPIKNKAVAFYGLIGARNIKTIKRTGQIISAKSDLIFSLPFGFSHVLAYSIFLHDNRLDKEEYAVSHCVFLFQRDTSYG